MSDQDKLKSALKELGLEDKFDQVLARHNINGPTTRFAGDQLIWLDLSNFGIKELPEGIFDELTNLQELKLFKNELTELPESIFDKLTELQEIHLKDNKITTIRKRHFQNNLKLHRIFLLGNPLPGPQAKVFPNRGMVEALINGLDD